MKPDGLNAYESCSLCCTEVLWTSMYDTDAGTLCRDCYVEGEW